jgi:hypothetical protein
VSVTEVLLKQGEILDGTRAVLKMNHENGGFDWCWNGRELCAGRAGSELHFSRPGKQRSHHPGQHETEPYPSEAHSNRSDTS